jgi:acetyl-CoA carboxylase biotin carboxyl carrier protein
MESRSLIELELEREGMRIRLKKASQAVSSQVTEYVPSISPVPSASHSQVQLPSKQQEEISAKSVIKSPMVGTFYRSPAPDAPPFVESGQDIEVGQVICIIEAMKLMNEIKSEVAGRIKEVLVENGDPVEFGQSLFSIEPRA